MPQNAVRIDRSRSIGASASPLAAMASARLRDSPSAKARSAISQGIGVATGLQKKFDWVGVAAAGVSNAAGGWVGRHVPVKSAFAYKALTGGAALLANAATRSLIEGSDFGDNIIAGLPSVIAQTVGGFVEDAVAGRGKPKTKDPDEIIVNDKALAEKGNRALAPNASALIYGDSATAKLLGADPSTISYIQQREELVAEYVSSAYGSDRGGGLFQSSLFNESYNNVPTLSFSEGDLARRQAYFDDLVSKAGPNPSAAVAADIARMGGALDYNRKILAQASAYADKQITELLRMAVPAVDIGIGGYNVVTGDGTIGDYAALTGAIPAGAVGKLGGVVVEGTSSFRRGLLRLDLLDDIWVTLERVWNSTISSSSPN
jgi:hypothetical protein